MNPRFYSKLPEIGSVVRYHQSPGPIQQTTAAHSWGVAWLITEFHPSPSVVLIKAALEHDMPEFLTGDMSYVAKQKYASLKSAMAAADDQSAKEMGLVTLSILSDEDHWWLKWADLMEGALWCRHLYEDFGFRQYLGRWLAYCDAIEGHTATGNAPESYSKNPDAWNMTLHVKMNNTSNGRRK